MSLHRKHVRSFLNSANNLGGKGVVLSDFDEPTYVGFWVEFDFNKPNSPLTPGNFDFLPNGLFGNEDSEYSAVKYLMNIGEVERADAMKSFNRLINDISVNTPHYIQNIGGLETLYKLDPVQNYRGKDAKISLNMLEGVDMRTTAMMDLYRRSAFDTTWMRWALPDIQRYFSMNIYITEFRSFHEPVGKSRNGSVSALNASNDNLDNRFGRGGGILNQKVTGYADQFTKAAESIQNAAGNIQYMFNKEDPLSLDGTPPYIMNTINKTLNVIKFELSDCEFVLSDLLPSWAGEISNATTTEQVSARIDIKVGKVREANEYNLLGAALFEGLDKIKSGLISDSMLDGQRQKTITPADVYRKYIGEGTQESINDDYSSKNHPYGNGHLAPSDDQVKKSIGERLIANAETQIINGIENEILSVVNGALLGNVYGISPLSIARQLAADPRAIGGAVANLINNSNNPSEAKAILGNIYDSLPVTPKNVEKYISKCRFNIEWF